MNKGEQGSGILYVVATPIGNLGDLSQRAIDTLGQVALVLAEDTRHTRPLLSHLGLSKPLESLHEHNEVGRADAVVARLADGLSIALVSDAGTPAVSDPGAKLVSAVARAGFRVVPIAGPSALTAALSACGFSASSSDVRFFGFLAVKGKDRREGLEKICAGEGVHVFFENPKRVHKTLTELAQRQPERPAALCRELTKVHEEVVRGTLQELAAWSKGGVRGEVTMVVGPQPQAVETDEQELREAVERCLAAGLSNRDASSAVAAIYRVSRKPLYQLCLELSGDRSS